ncbi:MAG: hypothetical protein M9955_25380 [Rhizobiaceae bacterium]|nr:hypothetical protein [Rhizobiaceae bacterium]
MLRKSRIAVEQTETLEYLQSMLAQLRTLAQAEHHDMLAYLIDMAHMEAVDIARGTRPSSVRKD